MVFSIRQLFLVRCFIGTTILLSITGIASAQQHVALQRLKGQVQLDGLSNEEAWQSIQPLPLVMHQPTHEGTMTERTELRIAYDSDYIYLAGRCYDSNPNAIQANSLTRDGMNPSDDFFGFVLDTFNDNENALAFFTTPAGLREDWAIFNDAESQTGFPFNSSWSTFWDAATVRTEEGWFSEMRIPFSSLRFQDDQGRVVIGLIAWRYIARKNEVQVFPNIPPKWNFSVLKPSVAQDVVLEGVYSRNPVYITPYIVGGAGMSNDLNDAETEYIRSDSRKRELGVDVKYGLTSNLTLDLTLNTDFAQVEADDQQVNLTRFSLFFPEKRLFFQERSSIFDVGMGGPNQLFYSRQIGLSEDEGPVRIYGGARVVGRVGSWDLGFLNMQTAKSVDLPAENFGVLRLRRQVFNENSYVGALLTSRVGNDGSYNYAYGLDGIMRIVGDDYLVLNWAQTFDDELIRPKYFKGLKAARARVQWEKRTSLGFGYEFNLSFAGPDFDPAMGFAPRVNYYRIGDRIFYGWLPGESSTVQTHNLSLTANTFFSNNDGSIESFEIGPEWNIGFKSGAFGRIALKAIKEVLTEEFELTDDITIPIGGYRFFNASCMYQTPWGGLVRSGFNLDVGSFYDGSRLSIGLQPVWSVSRYFELGGEYQFNKIRLPDQNLNAHLGRMRVKISFSTELSATTFLQLNTGAHNASINVRLRYNPREGNDLYLVYSEGLNTDRFRSYPIAPASDNRAVLLKYSHTFQF